MQRENEMMEHATRQGRLDALCIRAAEGTLTKQERTELDALFAEREAEAAVLKPTRERRKWHACSNFSGEGTSVLAEPQNAFIFPVGNSRD